ncbi:cytochrome P450 [Trebonia kvetii]|uniref:Cytochrome P450 n=1 Tax=Trebonia kvetii TaxID=2480626 RepID=A0A6P2C199_9ACTN|nr:cytochrome P450 [Trebonia kvetii]TVZ04930.1 cytochrome P450 [Trebonia kvetii]
MSLAEPLMRRVVEPSIVRYFAWRGDPVARWMRPQSKGDPYPLYEDIRRRGLVRSSLGPWVTASHATAETVLRDRRFSSSPVHQRGYQPPSFPLGDPRAELPAGDLLTLDPPDHTRIRRLVSGAFTPRAIAGLEPWIRERAVRLLDQADARGPEFNLIDAFAFPLPIAVICHLLGVPAEDQDKFRAWGHDVVTTLEPQTSRAARHHSQASEIALAGYLRDLVAKRRSDPDDSLLSALIAVEEEGDSLTSAELVSTALLLLVAGFETTVNLIGNGTVALLGERAQWDRLCKEPELISGAIEELLRYDSPVQMTSRTATEDLEVDGTVIRKGIPVIVSIGGANRDPAIFAEPGRLMVDRPEAARHLSFSLGIHHCLGAALARLEGRIAIEELTSRFPGLAMAGTPVRRPLLVLRGFETVPVRAAA